MGWSLCVTKELVQRQSLIRWPKTKVHGKGAWEVGHFQVSDKIQGVIWDWKAEVGEVVLRAEEDQEQRGQRDGGSCTWRLRLPGRMRGVGAEQVMSQECSFREGGGEARR